MARTIAALLVLMAACACDAPWAGPTIPSGAKPIAYTELGDGPVLERDGVYAATSIAAVRAAILRDTKRPDPCHPAYGDVCWERVPDQQGYLYVAVPDPAVCYRTVKKAATQAGNRLYFIVWYGKAQQPCNLMLRQPLWMLLAFARADLPASGTLVVDYETQQDNSVQDLVTRVDLT